MTVIKPDFLFFQFIQHISLNTVPSVKTIGHIQEKEKSFFSEGLEMETTITDPR